MRVSARWIVGLVLGAVAAPLAGDASPLGPSPYLDFADSPYAGGAYAYFHLEDNEGGALDVPGVTASAGHALPPDALTDSVDGDDGVIDGVGAGWSWKVDQRSVTFRFDPGVLGVLPSDVGIVWTDVGYSDSATGFGNLVFESFDENGDLLDTIGPVALGDGDVAGRTAEDRFFGSTHAGGISSIRITMDSADWELDHLQYGRVVPEPSTLSLVGTSLLVGAALRRRR